MQYTDFLRLIWWRSGKLLSFYWNAKNKYGIHSDYLFDFYLHTLSDHRNFYIYGDMITIESSYRSNNNWIEIIDYGAGSQVLNTKSTFNRKISAIYKKSASGRKKAQLLSKIVRWQKSKNILEIGSNLGIASGYLAGTYRKSKFVGLEGSPELAKLSSQVLKALRLKNAQIITGRFEDTLIPTLKEKGAFDLIFIDGNHSYQATTAYFDIIKQNNNGPTLLIFDDIYWSPDMFKAWTKIKNSSDVDLSIDLFTFGLCWLHSDLTIDPKHSTFISTRFKFLPIM